MLYGLLKTSSINIGDEIQSLAAYRFLPKVDFLIHRERTDEFYNKEAVSVIMNHWWMWNEKHWPPSDSINPLFVSFHLKYQLRNKEFMNSRVIDYFKQHEPIGCRDIGTMEFFQSNGIDAYFTGCLTTTLLPNISLKHRYMDDYVLCVDVPESVIKEIKKRSNKKILCIGRYQNVCFTYEQRLKLAKFTLFLYHNAHCVVTKALHAALPSTAFGTPVCVIDLDSYESKTRFDGMEDCFHMIKIDDFISNPLCYDVDNPPENPITYKLISDRLVEICKGFTGFDSEGSILQDDYNPLAELAEIMKYDEKAVETAMYYSGKRKVLRVFINRFFKGMDRHDLNVSEKCTNYSVFERSCKQ